MTSVVRPLGPIGRGPQGGSKKTVIKCGGSDSVDVVLSEDILISPRVNRLKLDFYRRDAAECEKIAGKYLMSRAFLGGKFSCDTCPKGTSGTCEPAFEKFAAKPKGAGIKEVDNTKTGMNFSDMANMLLLAGSPDLPAIGVNLPTVTMIPMLREAITPQPSIIGSYLFPVNHSQDLGPFPGGNLAPIAAHDPNFRRGLYLPYARTHSVLIPKGKYTLVVKCSDPCKSKGKRGGGGTPGPGPGGKSDRPLNYLLGQDYDRKKPTDPFWGPKF